MSFHPVGGPRPMFQQPFGGFQQQQQPFGLGGLQAFPEPNAAFTNLSELERFQLSQLTEPERITMRMWGHDIGDDGRNDGSVILKTLLNAEKSGNAAFLKTPTSTNTVFSHLLRDIGDDRSINGSSIRFDFGNIYEKVTGHNIMPQLMNAPFRPANLSLQEVFKPAPAMTTPEGLAQNLRDTGFSLVELLNTAIWGHDAVDNTGPGGRNLDGSVLLPSLNDPSSIDYHFVNSTPMTRNYVQGLIDRDRQQFGQVTGKALNDHFLSIIFNKIYR